jgi:hypothetical protein
VAVLVVVAGMAVLAVLERLVKVTQAALLVAVTTGLVVAVVALVVLVTLLVTLLLEARECLPQLVEQQLHIVLEARATDILDTQTMQTAHQIQATVLLVLATEDLAYLSLATLAHKKVLVERLRLQAATPSTHLLHLAHLPHNRRNSWHILQK